jgi:hypothetical protein
VVPEVQGVVRVSEDGSYVYFVAKGVLRGGAANGRERKLLRVEITCMCMSVTQLMLRAVLRSSRHSQVEDETTGLCVGCGTLR